MNKIMVGRKVDAKRWRTRRQKTIIRHLTKFLAYTKEHEQASAANYKALDDERDNLIKALSQGHATKQWEQLCHLTELLDGYLDIRGYWGERRIGLERAVDAANALGWEGNAAAFDCNLFIITYNTVGLGATDQEYLHLLKIFHRHLATFHRLGDRQNIAIVCHYLGLLEQARHNYAEAKDYYRQSLAFKTELGDQSGVAATLHQLGTLAHQQNQADKAQHLDLLR